MDKQPPFLSKLSPGARRWLLRGGVALLVLLAVRAALPLGVEVAVERVGGDALGRIVQVENVDLGLLRGVALIEGVAVGGAPQEGVDPGPLGPDATVLGVGRVAAELDWWPLLRGEVRVRSVEIDAPMANLVRRADGSFTQIVLAEPAPPEPEDPEAGPPPPFALDRLVVRNTELHLADVTASGEAELFEFDLEALSLTDFGMQNGEFSVGEVDLGDPRLRVRRALLLGEATASPEPAAPEPVAPADADAAPASGLPTARISHFAIERAQFTLLSDGKPLDAVLSVSLDNASLEPDERFPLKLRVEIGEGWVELDGRAGAVPPGYDGALRWAGMHFPVLLNALDLDLPLTIEAMSSSGDVELQVNLGDDTTPGTARAKGSARVTDLAVSSEADGLRATVASVEIEIEDVTAPLGGEGAPTVALKALRVTDPVVDFTRLPAPAAEEAAEAEPAQSVAEEPEEVAAETPAESPPAAPEPSLRLGQLELSGGELRFEDQTVNPYYRSTLRDLSVNASGLRWPERVAEKFALKLRGPTEMSVDLSGSLDGDAGDVKLVLLALGLAPLNPYATQLAGYRVEDGVFTLRSDVGFAGERIEVDSEILLSRLDIETSDTGSFEGQFGVPLDVGLALLRDPSGNIELPVRFAVERDELRASLWPTILAAFGQALVGAMTLPLKALKGLIPGRGDDEGISAFAAAPGAAAPVDAQETVSALATLLASRPELGIVLRGRVGEEDEAPLAMQLLADRSRDGEGLPELDGVSFFARRRIRGALEDHGADAPARLEAEDRAALERYVAAVEVPEARRAALAEKRARAIRESLLTDHGVRATRIRVAQAEPGAPGVVPELASVSSLPAQADDLVADDSVDAPPVGSR